MSPLAPIRETVEALAELDGCHDDALEQLQSLTGRVQMIVPDLVGANVTKTEHDLSFTLVSTAADIAAFGATHLVADRAGLTGARVRGTGSRSDEAPGSGAGDALDEQLWRLSAVATAAHAVRSTLTLLFHDDVNSVFDTVNLYAASSHGFAGHHEALAEVFGGRAGGAIINADLSFGTLATARRAPARARDLVAVEVAIGYLAILAGVDVDVAEDRLRAAAVRAGTTMAHLARQVIAVRRGRGTRG